MQRLRARRNRGARVLGLALLIGFAGVGGTVNGREGDIHMTDEPETTGEGPHAAREGADASPADGAGHTNRLIHEKSPYLLQHAHNPVDWYPWGAEAIAAAREQGKPIFLSVGYSTCHWCHVMAHESFEDDSIAALMNEHYINVKVDREERPDLDMLYMNAVQAMTGRGGWPMSVWLTPDLEPFFAGTYFPPTERQGMPGFATLIRQIADAWANDRERVATAGGQIAEAMSEAVRRIVESAGDGTLDAGVLERAHRELLSQYDAEHGGFGGAPKFPMPHYARFLLRYAYRSGHDDARRIVFHTLDRMASGGIHDHLAGGFHRYSTDRVWLAPHFEKMLYDQAGMALLYTDAWLVSGEPVHREVAEGILDYVATTLTHSEGGFYSAEDADSEGEEGTFYVWSPAEIDGVLGERGVAFRGAYDVSEAGNWEGKSILRTATPDPILDDGFAADRAKLLAHRDTRPRPHLDDKIITAWNGFMIEAFAHAGRSFGETRFLDVARRAATFVADSLWNDGDLLRHYREGAADVAAYLEDYAYFGKGLLALYEATFDTRWLSLAREVAARMAERFDHESGVLAFYGADQEQLLTQVVESHDGAMPSGVSVAANLLLRLGHLTADRALESRGERILEAYAGILSQQPTIMLELAAALDFSLGPITEVVVAGDEGDEAVDAMWRTVHGRYRPNTVCVHRPAGDAAELIRLVPYAKAQTAMDGSATAYVCEAYTCELPVHDAESLAKRLSGD